MRTRSGSRLSSGSNSVPVNLRICAPLAGDLSDLRTVQETPTIPPEAEFNTILVPLDGSAHAEHALPFALSIARRNGATIRLALVHAPITPNDDPWSMYHRSFLVDVDQERVRHKQDYLNSVRRRIQRRDSVRVVTVLSEGERTADQLCIAAQGADLIVMATHARGRLAKLWHGSMADSLIRRVDCPLLLVRGYRAPVDLTGDPIPGNVLVPLDGSPCAEQVVPAVAEIARIGGADVTLLHVDRSLMDAPSACHPLDYLRTASSSVVSKVQNIVCEVVTTDESLDKAVVSSVDQQDFDLIALTTRARHGLSRWGRSSLMDAVLRRSSAPVLVMRGQDTCNSMERTASTAAAV